MSATPTTSEIKLCNLYIAVSEDTEERVRNEDSSDDDGGIESLASECESDSEHVPQGHRIVDMDILNAR